MKSNKLEKFNKYWRRILSEPQELLRFQFKAVYIIFFFVSIAMSIMNYRTNFLPLMYSTIAFAGCCVFNLLIGLINNKVEFFARILFALQITALFSFFIVFGEPEGFSVIWVILVPACALLLYHRRWGSIISLCEFLILIFFFWTPWGRDLLLYKGYTEPMLMRFPIAFISFYFVELIFEITRATTQSELIIAKNKYANLYTEEKVRAEQEKEKNFEIIKVLASEYSSVYYVDLNTNTFEPYTMNEATSSELGSTFKSGISFSKAYELYIGSMVYVDDQPNMLNAGTVQNIKDELIDKKSFETIYRSEDLHYCEMKFVKMGPIDSMPEFVALGFADRDAQIREREEYQKALEDAKTKAENASQAKSRFLFDMSHDIRTPMNAIIGFTDMAKKYKDDDEKLLSYLDKVKISSEHLLKLINDVLDMSRIESGKATLTPVLSEIVPSIDELCLISQEEADEHNINFVKDLSNVKSKRVYVDTLRMNQILLNVINNAIKYTNAGGNVTFTVNELERTNPGFITLEFIVKDTGIGMEPEFLEHIFEAFAREKNSTMSGVSGTGLGMSITKHFIDMMDGTINIESTKNVGTTVTIVIPFKEDDSIEETKEVYSLDSSEISLEGRKVLIVDDNDLNREIAKDILEEFGLLVDEAEDGDISVDILKEKGPDYYDYVLMDIQMPTMNGYAATKAIRSLGNADYSSLPIIALTANAFEEDRKNAFAAGMDEHLGKPIDIEKMINILKRFTKKK